MKRGVATLFVLTLLTAAPPSVLADVPAQPVTEQQRAHLAFLEGQGAFEAGDFRRAAAAFEAAYAAKPHHAALWNAARSWQRAGEDLTAANLLERYLREAPADAPDRDEATRALATIVKRVGRVQLQVAGVTNAKIDGATRSEQTIAVAPGEHVATGEDGTGATVRKVFRVGAGEIVSVTLAREEPRVDQERRSTKPLPPWLVYGGGALVAIGGALTVVSGLDTLDKRDAFRGEQTQARLDDGYASQARTNVFLGVTAGVAVLTAAAAIFLVDWGGATRSTGPRASAGR